MRRCIALLACAVAACAHQAQKAPAEEAAAKPGPEVVAAAPEVASPKPEVVPAAPVPEATCASDEACKASELCLEARCVPITRSLVQCRPTAHFDFDRSDLHDEDLPPLQRAARCLMAQEGERALIEGHCDERGTTEYNLHLGERRAHAVRAYLTHLGVPAERVSTVSYGKERPLCVEHEESCWWRNRRGEVTWPERPLEQARR